MTNSPNLAIVQVQASFFIYLPVRRQNGTLAVAVNNADLAMAEY
jgi:hypothetical protein